VISIQINLIENGGTKNLLHQSEFSIFNITIANYIQRNAKKKNFFKVSNSTSFIGKTFQLIVSG